MSARSYPLQITSSLGNWLFHNGNAPAHRSNLVQLCLTDSDGTVLPQYSQCLDHP
jgi:hypothetical protein